MQLYREYKDGQFVDVNDDVLKLLIKFLVQKTSPSYTSQLDLRPHVKKIDERSEEEKLETSKQIKFSFHNTRDIFMQTHWRVPLFEHIFFRSKVGRNRITHMKPQWHVPHQKYPKIFEWLLEILSKTLGDIVECGRFMDWIKAEV